MLTSMERHSSSAPGCRDAYGAFGRASTPRSFYPSLRQSCRTGFTLIELCIVLAIVATMFYIVRLNPTLSGYWREEGFLRRLSQTLTFLHYQAVSDQAFYQVEFSFGDRGPDSFKVGVLKPEGDDANEAVKQISSGAGALSLELAQMLHPALGEGQTFIPPPNMPSLGEKVEFPATIRLRSIRTMRGKESDGRPIKEYALFSPRGFSEFLVLNLEIDRGEKVTMLVNPFTGETEVYRGEAEFRDFQWTYGGDKGKKK